jgi:hypothetical protein
MKRSNTEEPIMAKKTITVHLTEDNVTSELRPGDVFADDPEWGAVRSVRLTRDGYSDAMVYTTTGRDVLGLPQTVRLIRTT